MAKQKVQNWKIPQAKLNVFIDKKVKTEAALRKGKAEWEARSQQLVEALQRDVEDLKFECDVPDEFHVELRGSRFVEVLTPKE